MEIPEEYLSAVDKCEACRADAEEIVRRLPWLSLKLSEVRGMCDAHRLEAEMLLAKEDEVEA